MNDDKKALIIRKIPADVRKALKVKAAQEGKTMQGLVLELIAQHVACSHPYAEETCQFCGKVFCYSCCGGTNVDQGGKHEADYMICPACGKNTRID